MQLVIRYIRYGAKNTWGFLKSTNKTLLLLILFLLISCRQQEQPTISFYYWKTIFKLSSTEKNILSYNEIKKVYIRYFDIDLEAATGEPFPGNPIRFEEKASQFHIVPVVYIRNIVMLQKKLNIVDLAKKTNDFIKQINAKNRIEVQEIQIDCDWTLGSKDNYLRFIEEFKKISHKKLSATIRLHQIKYFKKTKIPHVDSGVLMYYNMGKIASDSLNSIYDRNIAQRYLASLKNYPLPINIAFPIYSWGVHIREGQVIGLQNKIDVNNLKKDVNFTVVKNNWIKVQSSNYKGGVYYQEGDFLKQEAVSTANLIEMGNDLGENIKQNPQEIIFYDLDEFNLKKYEKNIFKKIATCF